MSNDGYIRSTRYIDRYYGEFNPWMLRYIAALHGFAAPDFNRGFTFCDLGCGSGMTPLVLAASNPTSQFWGVDFNAEHIRSGNHIKNRMGIENCTLLERSFGALAADALPDMDFITLHGVYSWVSDNVKRDILDILRWKVKPGGMVLITYNTLPGWSPLAPLRDFMREYAIGSSDDILEVAREGMTYLRFLCDSDAPYFRHNPTAGQMLEMLEGHDLHYIAHEFFTEFWRPLYFREVAKDLGEIGLNFCGQTPLYLNYGEICLPENVQNFIRTAPSRTVFETHKDFVRNTMFRWDIFVKGTPQFVSDSPENNRTLRFGLLKQPDEVQREMQVQGGRKITLNGAIYDRVISFFSENCGAELGELLDNETMSEYEPDAIVSAVQYLVMLDALKPFAQRATMDNTIEGKPSTVNKVMAEMSLVADGSAVLASAVYGAGVMLGRDDVEELLKETTENQLHNELLLQRAKMLGLIE